MTDQPISWTWGARIAAGYLYGGFVLGMGLALLISGPIAHSSRSLSIIISAIVALGAMILSSAAWGRAIARKVAPDNPRLLARRAAAGFAISIIVAGAGLNLLEPFAIKGGVLPIHIAYGTLFVPAAFVIVVGTTAALTAGLRHNNGSSRRLPLTVGLFAATTYLVTYLLMLLAGGSELQKHQSAPQCW